MSVNFIEEIKEKSANCEVCLNCKHSYIQDETGFGFCKFVKNAIPSGFAFAFLKPITELHTCPHWDKKTKENANTN